MNDPTAGDIELTPAEPAADVKPPRRRIGWSWLRHLLLAVLAFLIVIQAFGLGMQARRWTYEQTNRVRHEYDIKNNLYYGTRALIDEPKTDAEGDVVLDDEGVLNLYGNVQREMPSDDYKLDYVPLRLVTMREWARWVRANYGTEEGWDERMKRRAVLWQRPYEFTAPLLYFNAAMEALSCIAIFLLIRLWIRRSAAAEREPPDAPQHGVPLDPWRGVFSGLIGALLMWFSPAAHISAHAWPSWDIWIVPFYLWTVLLACWGGWFWSGVVLGIGTMFKGQQLMMVPLMLLWPIFMAQWTAPLRWLAGYGLAVTVIVSPWLLRDELTREWNTAAMAWLVSVIVAGIAAVAIVRWLWRWEWRVLALAPLLLVLTWPWLLRDAATNDLSTAGFWWALVVLLLTIGAFVALRYVDRLKLRALIIVPVLVALLWPWLWAWDVPHLYLAPLMVFALAAAFARNWRARATLAAATVAVTLAMCPVLFGGDFSWYDVSFRYGSEKFGNLYQWSANTLPSLLARKFGLRNLNEAVYVFNDGPDAFVFTLKMLLITLYGVCLVLCALGMALQTRRRDRNFLAAMAAPWLVAFVFMPQMHSRYLLFGACAAAVSAGLGVGMVLLTLILMLLSWMMTLHLMMGGGDRNPRTLQEYLGEWGPLTQQIIRALHPDIAWVIILIALIFLHVGLTRSRHYWPVPWRERLRFLRRSSSPSVNNAQPLLLTVDAPPTTATEDSKAAENFVQ